MQTTHDLQAENKTLKERLASVEAERDFLLDQFNLARHRQFGASSEKEALQPSLFNEQEAELDTLEEAPSQEVVEDVEGRTQRRSKPKRKPLPKISLAKHTLSIFQRLKKAALAVMANSINSAKKKANS